MNLVNASVLTINAGSSSIKFAVYQLGNVLESVLYGQVDRIGLSGARLTFQEATGERQDSQYIDVDATDYHWAAAFLLEWLQTRPEFTSVQAVGHRVVHGMKHSEPQRITTVLLEELNRIMPFDLEHLPLEIALIELFLQRYPQLPQVACFDTAFHCNMPQVASLLPIPRRFEAQGVRRYGFHGLSYEFLMTELARLGDAAATQGRVILAHLGNGASLVAVRNGRSIDTSMSFTPTAGIPMSTRSGDLDPGLVWYLARTEKMSAKQFNEMVNFQSGLLGLSETSSDMRELLACEADDTRATEAIALYCYQIKKWIGAYAAALGGLDTLVFAGGIGENAPLVRERICDGLNFLGIALNPAFNAKNARLISAQPDQVKVRVICTNEQLMIARSVIRVLNLDSQGGTSKNSEF
ncbi:MAG: acetate/propionate family kinase [Nitrosomonas sp.]|nr:acetate/propionate family kinase [Nitrosomonas sp.]MDP1949755.1 acetate/propionate family kinase [Nitrosomonas sp.]